MAHLKKNFYAKIVLVSASAPTTFTSSPVGIVVVVIAVVGCKQNGSFVRGRNGSVRMICTYSLAYNEEPNE